MFSKRLVKVVASLFVLMLAVTVPALADIQELYFGGQIYDWLYSTGVIVSKSPLYNDVLNPITEPLKAVARPKYDTPFIFTIGHDPYPNVASVPGGRVYVSDKTFDVLKYREELAGALCHAVAHTTRHDFAPVARRAFNMHLAPGLLMVGVGASYFTSVLTNPLSFFDPRTTNNIINAYTPSKVAGANAAAGAISAAGNSGPLTVAEDVELKADVAGADMCAKAGLNPWGLVWLLQNYQKSAMHGRMEMLSVAPDARVQNLKTHFANNPDVFGKFDPDRAHGTPMRQN